MTAPDLAAFTAEYANSPFAARTMYLFLVHELTGESVRMDNKYPLDVDLKCEQVRRSSLSRHGNTSPGGDKRRCWGDEHVLTGHVERSDPQKCLGEGGRLWSGIKKMGFIHSMPADDCEF